MSSTTFTFVIDHPVSNGTMTFDVARDEWVVYGRDAVTIDRIDANTFKTIKEFKEWAYEAITKKCDADLDAPVIGFNLCDQEWPTESDNA